jgi:hypothetical protein
VAAGQLGLTGGAQPIFFIPNPRKTRIQLLLEAQQHKKYAQTTPFDILRRLLNNFWFYFKLHKVYFFEIIIKFYIKSSPKILKLGNISRGIPFLGSHGFRVDFRPHKVYFLEHKILHQIKPKNIKITPYFTWK